MQDDRESKLPKLFDGAVEDEPAAQQQEQEKQEQVLDKAVHEQLPNFEMDSSDGDDKGQTEMPDSVGPAKPAVPAQESSPKVEAPDFDEANFCPEVPEVVKSRPSEAAAVAGSLNFAWHRHGFVSRCRGCRRGTQTMPGSKDSEYIACLVSARRE